MLPERNPAVPGLGLGLGLGNPNQKELSLTRLPGMTKKEVKRLRYRQWQRMDTLICIFRDLVNISKQDDAGKHTQMLATILRSGCAFVDAFLRGEHLLTDLTLLYPLRRRTLETIGKLQKATRQLQHLCAFAKENKDSTLRCLLLSCPALLCFALSLLLLSLYPPACLPTCLSLSLS